MFSCICWGCIALFSNEDGTNSCRVSLPFSLKRFCNEHEMKSILETGRSESSMECFSVSAWKRCNIIMGSKRERNDLPPFKVISKSCRFQGFTPKLFMPFSNYAVSKSFSFDNDHEKFQCKQKTKMPWTRIVFTWKKYSLNLALHMQRNEYDMVTCFVAQLAKCKWLL